MLARWRESYETFGLEGLKTDVLTGDPYSAGVEARGEGKCFLGSAFFSVFHCTAFLLNSTGFSADFLYSLGVIYSSEECGLFPL